MKDHNSEKRGRQDAPLKYSKEWRERQDEIRIEAYMFKIFRNDPNGESNHSQATLAKYMKMRRTRFVEALERLIQKGRIERIEKPNGNRRNPRFGYSGGRDWWDSFLNEPYTYSIPEQD